MNGDSKDGTSHLKKHLDHCFSFKRSKKGQLDVGQQMIKMSEVQEDGSCVVQNFKFDQENSRIDLARMIILHKLPFRFVEYEGFRNYVKGLQPMFKMISRTTVKSDCMKIF